MAAPRATKPNAINSQSQPPPSSISLITLFWSEIAAAVNSNAATSLPLCIRIGIQNGEAPEAGLTLIRGFSGPIEGTSDGRETVTDM
jgi:hypothetical protein